MHAVKGKWPNLCHLQIDIKCLDLSIICCREGEREEGSEGGREGGRKGRRVSVSGWVSE